MRITFQIYSLSNLQVYNTVRLTMWELYYKESWVPKNWCFWTVVLKIPLDCRDLQSVHPKGDQPLMFFGRADVEAETPILWPPDAKKWLIGKDLMLGKIEGRRKRRYRGWDGWMASPTLWTWVWISSRSWWWTGKPGVPQSMGSLPEFSTVCCDPHSLRFWNSH